MLRMKSETVKSDIMLYLLKIYVLKHTEVIIYLTIFSLLIYDIVSI